MRVRFVFALLFQVALVGEAFPQLYGRYNYVSVPLSEATEELRHFHLSITLMSENIYSLRVGLVNAGHHTMQEFSVGTFDVVYDTLRLTEADNSYQMKYLFRNDSLLPVHTFSGLTDIALTAEKNGYVEFLDVCEFGEKRYRHPRICHFASPIPIKAKGVFGHENFHQLILKEDHTYTLAWRGYLISEGTWKRRLNRVTLSDSVLNKFVRCVIKKRRDTVWIIFPYHYDLPMFEYEAIKPAKVEKLKNRL